MLQECEGILGLFGVLREGGFHWGPEGQNKDWRAKAEQLMETHLDSFILS